MEVARDIGGTVVRALQGDLTALEVDAIVNAANEHLAHGGGVAAAIVRAGGRSIQDESTAWVREHGPVRPGTAAVTGAGDLPAHVVVHVVGPRYQQGRDNEGLLRAAVSAALVAAVEAGARSIAFPAISAGIFGYPRHEATAVIAAETVAWLAERPGQLDEVVLVGWDRATAQDFAAGLVVSG